jgi:Transposase IS4
MYVPRKPWPQGNEYHTACCGASGVLFQLELVEDKDHLTHVPVKFPDVGKVLDCCFGHKGHAVVLDSGFCVLEGIVRFRENGVFAASLIKQRKYWPKNIKGDNYITHFANKKVDDVDCLPGKLIDQDFYIFCMKEPDYNMLLMLTYGSNKHIKRKTTIRNYKNSSGDMAIKSFNYPEVAYNHCHFRNSVGNHNNKRHQPICIEEIWTTKWWLN